MRVIGRHLAGLAVAFSALAISANAQQATAVQGTTANGNSKLDEAISAEGYILPPDAIARLVNLPRESIVTYGTPSPVTRRWFVRNLSDGLPALEFVGKVHHNLAGWQIDPVANRSRTMTMRSNIGYELLDWSANKATKIEMPAGARAGSTSWSPDGMTLAFVANFRDATHIYLADPVTGKSRPLTRTSLLATNVQNFEWTADGRSIVAVLVPDGRGAEPKAPVIEPTPMVRVNEANKLKTRTYPDLLETPYEKDLVKFHSTGQLAVIDVRTRAVKKIGAPGMIRSLSPSPEGKFFRVTYVDEPFSYVLPVSSFGSTEVVIDEAGKVLHQIAKRPLREGESTDIVDPAQTVPAQGAGGRGAAAMSDTAKRNLNI